MAAIANVENVNKVSSNIHEDIWVQVSNFFNVKELKTYQKEGITATLTEKRDSFICQPTGSGKSLVYQALPYVKQLLTGEDKGFVVLVSPLISLMRDQGKSLEAKKISHISLSDMLSSTRENADDENISADRQGKKKLSYEDLCQNIIASTYQIIITSPELILTKFRSLFKNKRFGKNLLAIAVDESHCVAKWGYGSSQVEAFRSYYGRLSEVRSLLSSPVPMIALTATATSIMEQKIIESLSLYNPIVIKKTPEKSNIKYHIIKINTRNPDEIFKFFVDELNEHGYECKRALVFCRTVRDVTKIYKYFKKFCKSKSKNVSYESHLERPYAMFHSKTDEVIKDHVLAEFTKSKGTVRFLVATVAFGMGVDCKDLNQVLHYGPPSDISDYFQESGRIGRDGSASDAILIDYPRCLVSSRITKSMKVYTKNQETCRRTLLLKEFDVKNTWKRALHLCCDVCEINCECAAVCTHEKLEVKIKYEENKAKTVVCDAVNRLSGTGERILREQLLAIRSNNLCNVKGMCGNELTSGFPDSAIDQIIKNANELFNIDVIMFKTSLLNEKLYEDVILAVEECVCLYGESVEQRKSDSNSSSEESDKKSGSNTDTDSDVDFQNSKYRAPLNSSCSSGDDGF